ncbi:hypothetical protein [uncultured Lutibacter sp.]|uniref:OB-fold protein n=1 Tax=uncultured Lutibacter sp. TaxID=437739 RepID=UPI002634BE80|nr:hypothetical protein [uncultured Lutibacter sp.]
MKNKTFKIISIVGIVLIFLLGYALKQYNKPHIDIKNAEASIYTSVHEIVDEFQQDEFLANKKYTDNIIQLKGTIFEISINEGYSVITLKSKNNSFGVICNMLPENNLDAIKHKKGDVIEIRGVCTGYLLDLIMVKCVLINNSNNLK